MKRWVVTGTSLVVEAETEEEAVDRAQETSGWHWEAVEQHERQPREYRGITIHPMRTNSMGCRWWAFGPERMLQADTLDGMRELIRDALGVR